MALPVRRGSATSRRDPFFGELGEVRVQFDTKPVAIMLFGNQPDGSRPAERVEDDTSLPHGPAATCSLEFADDGKATQNAGWPA
jgi:hypothetical protein